MLDLQVYSLFLEPSVLYLIAHEDASSILMQCYKLKYTDNYIKNQVLQLPAGYSESVDYWRTTFIVNFMRTLYKWPPKYWTAELRTGFFNGI